MPVSTENSVSGPYVPNGVTRDFAFEFKATVASEVKALDQDGAEIPSSLFSVSLDDDEGGSLSFSVAPTLAQYSEIYIVGDPSLTQPSDFDNAGPSFNPAALTRAFDRAAERDLRQQREINRALTVPFPEPGFILPRAADRQGYYLGFSASGAPIAIEGTGDDGTVRPDLASTDSAKGAALVGFKQPFTDAANRTALVKERERVTVDDWGASGDLGNDSTAAFEDAFAVQAAKIAALEAGSPDTDYSRGVPLKLVEGGRYIISAPLVPPKYLQMGGEFPRQSNLQGLMVQYTGTSPFLTTSGDGLEYGAIQNVGFLGTLTTDFCTPNTAGGGFPFTTFSGLGFYKWKKLETIFVGSRVRDCEFRGMPNGNLKIASSDAVFERNFFNCDPQDGTTGTKHTYCVEMQGGHNSRWSNNYYTGSLTTPRPQCLLVANSHDTEFVGDWYDYSDGPCVQVQASYNLRWSGGKINFAAQSPPTTDSTGGSAPTRFNCGFLINRGYDILIDGMTFKNLPSTAPAFRVTALTDTGTGLPLPGKIVIRNTIMDDDTTVGEVRVVSDDTTGRAFPIFCDDYERKHRAIGGAEMPVSGGLYTIPPVMRSKLSLPQSVGAAIGVPGYALPGRRIEILNLGTNVSGVNLLTSNNPHTGAADTIRDQSGMTKIRQTAQPGKALILECFEMGVWETVNSTATLTYAA